MTKCVFDQGARGNEAREDHAGAQLKKDDDGLFWLIVESPAGPAMFNLSAIETNPIIHEKTQIEFDDVLEAFMNEQAKLVDPI